MVTAMIGSDVDPPRTTLEARLEADAFRARLEGKLRLSSIGVLVLFGSGVLLQWLGYLTIPMPKVAILIGLVFLGNILCGLALRAGWRLVPIFIGVNAGYVANTAAILYLMPELALGVGPLCYVLIVVNGGVSGLFPYLFANLSVGSYALTLAAIGHLGGDGAVSLVITTATLNLLAAYVDRERRTLGKQRAGLAAANARLASSGQVLEQQVHERTRELEQTNAALAERSARLRNFVYTVTHDLKNPVTAILLTADLMLDREANGLGREGRQDLERIARLASVTENMIRDILELFRITSAQEPTSDVDIGALVDEVVDDLAPEIAAKGARISVGVLPGVRGQAGKLRHVVANLVGNAVKYVRTGAGEIDVSAVREDDAVVISVCDNGVGIPAEYHEGIFRVFTRVPLEGQQVDGRPVAGTGVGLAIVRRIVEMHGGTVRVESEPGRGSRFIVRLPGVQEERAAS
jgi:signal transduction histidine kinase